MQDKAGQNYSYWIDADDIIIRLDENWRRFAQSNQAADSCLPQHVIGSSIWDHIDDEETAYFYKIILEKVRRHQHRAVFPFRCDAPDKRRFLELSLIPQPTGLIHFDSRLLKVEMREPVELLSVDIDRSNEKLSICSMCKKIAVSSSDWEEVETAIQTLRLFEQALFPQLSHGICQSCFDVAMDELQRLEE